MKILVLNCGSSSVKFMVIRMPEENILLKGIAEKFGSCQLRINVKYQDLTEEAEVFTSFDYPQIFDRIFDIVHKYCIVGDRTGIPFEAVGHRLVHGGEGTSEGAVLTAELLTRMRNLVSLAPLHYPANLAGIEAVFQKLPGIFQAGVFDTAFHQTMPPHAFHYAIPMKFYQKYAIRKYGFHGSSHQYVAQRACMVLKKDYSNSRIITCHLGSGASVAAIRNGRSIDTSMGFTPAEGLVMASRSGDIDPGVLFFLMKNEKLSPDDLESLLNRESGLLGLSGVSSDIREVLDALHMGNEEAKLAVDAYVYRVKKYIGAYYAILGGCDLLVFTGGTGENSSFIRKEICRNLEFMGIIIDDAKNSSHGGAEQVISTENSGIEIMVIPSFEEMVIARETFRLFMERSPENSE